MSDTPSLNVRVGCAFEYTSVTPTPMIFVVRPGTFEPHHIVVEAQQMAPQASVEDFLDHYGNRTWRVVAPPGAFTLSYDAVVEVSASPDLTLPALPQVPIEQLPYDVLPFTLPSRYCDSDLFTAVAWELFRDTPLGWPRVQAICDWMHREITYGAGSSSHTSGYQAFEQRRGVCRDFAHIGICFCRALNIPARYVYGYLPDIGVPIDPSPMDFHAWFEAYLGGAWYTFDARHNIPRIGRVVIGRGRDAVDVAMTTIYGGSQLVQLRVWADETQSRELTPRPNL